MPQDQTRPEASQLDGGDGSKELCIILPALNEAQTIGHVIRRIPRKSLRVMGYSPRVLVVDGRSTDPTLAIASAKGAEIVMQDGRGKGDALRQVHEALLAEARRREAPAPRLRRYVVLDADGTYPPETITDLVAALDSGYDLVLGSRFLGIIHPGAMTRLNRIGNRFLTRIFRILNRVDLTDVCTGMYALNERVFENLSLRADGFDVEADLFTAASLMNARFGEVPVDYRRRVGAPKLIPLRSGLRIGWRMFVRRVQGLDGRPPLSVAPRRPLHPFIAWTERVRDASGPSRLRTGQSGFSASRFVSLFGLSPVADSNQEWPPQD